jgi:hypothetical protein
MTAPWQLHHEMIHADEAALARTCRRAAHLADVRAGTEPGRLRRRMTAAGRAVMRRIPLPEPFAPMDPPANPPRNRPGDYRYDLKVSEVAPICECREECRRGAMPGDDDLRLAVLSRGRQVVLRSARRDWARRGRSAAAER